MQIDCKKIESKNGNWSIDADGNLNLKGNLIVKGGLDPTFFTCVNQGSDTGVANSLIVISNNPYFKDSSGTLQLIQTGAISSDPMAGASGTNDSDLTLSTSNQTIQGISAPSSGTHMIVFGGCTYRSTTTTDNYNPQFTLGGTTLSQYAGQTYPPNPTQGTGGNITQSGGYTIHTFPYDNVARTFTPAYNGTVDYLVVAGGGGGGGSTAGTARGGCGGGAGGILSGTLSVTANTGYSVFVGNGGDKGYKALGTVQEQGHSGGASNFSTISATGGGGAGGSSQFETSSNGLNGGSGGGATQGGGTTAGTGIAGQGFAGAQATCQGGAGGGGKSAVGISTTSAVNQCGGSGGAGMYSSISGTSVGYGGGGGGGALANYGAVAHGGPATEGGGAGADSTYHTGGYGYGADGSNGGGGGGGSNGDGGYGGNGIVIVRYVTYSPPALPTLNNASGFAGVFVRSSAAADYLQAARATPSDGTLITFGGSVAILKCNTA